MNKKRVFTSIALLAVLLFCVQVFRLRNNLTLPSQSEAAGENKKEISKSAPRFAAPLGDGFTDINSPPEYLNVGSDYWVRLGIQGKTISATQTYVGSDIMLVLDVTGSMTQSFPVGSSSPGVNTSRIQAAKQALRNFVDQSKASDNIGFATFAACDPVNQKYHHEENNIPISWVYEGLNSTGRDGYSYLHVPINPATNTQKSRINTLLQDTGTDGVLRFANNQIIFCKDPVNRTAHTNPGGGIVGGLSQLTNLIQSQRRTDSSLFRTSIGGAFQTPNYRSDKKKYIVLATDGEENYYPRAYDSQPIIQQLNISGIDNAVEYSREKSIVVYTLSIARDDSSFAQKLRQIALDTGGKFFPGNTRDQLIDSYSQIYDEVEEVATGGDIIVEEHINPEAFKILDLNPAGNLSDKFYVSRFENGVEINVTNEVCLGGSCITKNSDNSYSFKLPALDTGKKYNIYFKVQATNTSLTPVAVDGADSKVIYSPTISTPIENKFVVIDTPAPFFQASEGDFYSEGDITNNLRENEYLLYKDASILFRKGNLNIGEGEISSTNRDARYGMEADGNYQYFRELLDSQIVEKTLTSSLGNRADISPQGPSSDKYIVKLNSPSGVVDLKLNGNFNDNITRVVLVDGDLLISEANYRIQPNGKNGLIFIVSGRIGIGPSIGKVEGIFVADEYIDTACNNRSGFGSDECAPATADAPLVVEGSVLSASGGIRLNRKGTPIGTIDERVPGEEFIYRPDLTFSAVNAIGKVQRTWKEATD